MLRESTHIQLSVSKLIALWAFSECTLGGILHALQIPFSGILLGGIAVTIVCCIGFTAERPFWAILYATLVAISVKFALSPHTPVTAYLAVGFQGFLGALFFSFQTRFYPIYLIYGALALVESALQKLLTLTIIFGNALWDSFHATTLHVVNILGLNPEISYGAWILVAYTMIYLVWGAIIGHWAYFIPIGIKDIPKSDITSILSSESEFHKKKKKGKALLWLSMALILFASVWIFHLSGINILKLIIRPIIIILLWWGVVNPIVKVLLARFLKGKNDKMSHIIRQIKQDIPQLQRLALQTAYYTGIHYKGINRIRHFILILIVLSCEKNSDLA